MARTKKKTSTKIKTPKSHEWRMCPRGQHWVSTHPMHIPPSKKHPEGAITTRRGHCAKNPSGKDQLYPDEILEITKAQFKDIKNKPCSSNLGFKTQGSLYDAAIAGWTQYWNEVLSPKISLDPNIVKALIASESGFNPDTLANKKNQNSARGLMQINNQARKILGDEKEEIKDHYLTITREQLNDPSINICAGIRWLFQKQKLASVYLKREASWKEAVMNYKGQLQGKENSTEAIKQKKIFNDFLSRLVKCDEK